MDSLTLLRNVVDETTRLVKNVPDDQMSAPSPCEGWTVRDVVNHITGGATMFAISAEQGSVPDDEVGQLMAGDNLGNDPQGAWATASKRALNAFQAPGALEKVVKLPFAELPASAALDIAVFDVATHVCDIAHATGQSVQDDKTFEAALEMGKAVVGADFRVPGVFDAELSAPAGATISERLLAFGGRRLS